jgi:hypothetical protein
MTDELENQIRALRDGEPPTAAEPAQIVASITRRHTRRRQLTTGALGVCAAGLIAGTVLLVTHASSSTHHPEAAGTTQAANPGAGAPACLPPSVSLQGTSLDATSGLPMMTAPRSTSVMIKPTEVASTAPITNLTILIGTPGSDPGTTSSTLPIPANQVLAHTADTVNNATALTAPATAGRYPIIVTYDYTDASTCTQDPTGGGRATTIVGYLTVP